MSGYTSDRKFSDESLNRVMRELGQLLFKIADEETDMQMATDIVVPRTLVAVRIRRNEYVKRYGYEFTIRAERDSGARTELAKILDGYGDFLFYAFEGTTRYVLIDLAVFRDCADSDPYTEERLGQFIANGDGTHFVAFDVREMPREVVRACSYESELCERSLAA